MSLNQGGFKVTETEKYTQEDSDNLADIIWWIKGYRAASEAGYADQACPFQKTHMDSLRKARVLLENLVLNKKEKEQK